MHPNSFHHSHILPSSLPCPTKVNRESKQTKTTTKCHQTGKKISFIPKIITKSYIFILHDFYLAIVIIVELINLVSIYVCCITYVGFQVV